MELGTAIFLSVVLIFILTIIVVFKDRIRWKKFFIFLVISICISAAAIFVMYQPYIWRGKVDELNDMKLGDSEKDLLFQKGESYAAVCEFTGEKGTHRTYYYSFDGYDKHTDVYFTLNGSIIKIARRGDVGTVSWPYRNSISEYDTESTLISKLGDTYEQFDQEDRSRNYVWSQYNLVVELKNNRVTGVLVRNPAYYTGDNYAFQANDNYDCKDAKGKQVDG
jgi:hypothetical protein